MTPGGDGEWSCGTCTFFNKPLFLSCEMCGQARPSQRPSPPRRQPSLDLEGEELDLDLPLGLEEEDCHHHLPLDDIMPSIDDVSVTRGSTNSGDRAPRSVQRHRSTVDISGTLIMTDDPADYETQDGKKPGEDVDEAEQDTYGQELPRTREDDPTLDESMERHMLEPARRGMNMSNSDARHHRDSRRRSHHYDSYSQSQSYGSSMEHSSSYQQQQPHHSHRRHTYQTRERDYHPREQQNHHHAAPPCSARKPYASANGSAGSNSNQTLPTAYMGSSSRGLQLEDNSSFADDVSSLSSGGRSGSRCFHHSMNNSSMMSSSSRRLGGSGRPRPTLTPATPQEVHYHGRSTNGLPVITTTREASTPNYHHRRTSSNNNGALMGDSSAYSYCSSSHDSTANGPHTNSARRPSAGMGASASMRHISVNPDASSRNANLRRGASVANIGMASAGAASGGDFLPSLAPPPVPTMDSPGDVDVMAVFVKDQQAVAEKQSRRKSNKNPNEARKDRNKMFDNLSRSGAFSLGTSNNNTSSSNLSMGAGSGISLASSSRRLQPTSQRGLSTRLLGGGVTEEAEEEQAHPFHPAMAQDDALDSPNTRKERRKEKRRMKGAVRTLMATMRIASITK